jgi:8-oxo-dGTP pyrophosphatase MutT (NUDIX family)
VKPWIVKSSRTLVDRPWLRIRVEEVETSRGVTIDEYHVLQTRDWACVVCITEDQELVLVEQYRHGAGKVTLEFPAGAIDAKRELLEETGYAAPIWLPLLAVSPETTRHSHQAHLFLALGAKLHGPQQLEATEDVEVTRRKLTDTTQLASELSHGIHVAAWLLAKAHLSNGIPA